MVSRPAVPRVRDVRRFTVDSVTITGDANHASAKRFAGWSVRESATIAGAARINFRLGSVSGQILAVLELQADRSDTMFFPCEFQTPGGVYVEVASGTVSGVLLNRGDL